jgi:hypothetical protein
MLLVLAYRRRPCYNHAHGQHAPRDGMNLHLSVEDILAIVALGASIVNHFRVSKLTVKQVNAELKADAAIASAKILADALVASAKLKSEREMP